MSRSSTVIPRSLGAPYAPFMLTACVPICYHTSCAPLMAHGPTPSLLTAQPLCVQPHLRTSFLRFWAQVPLYPPCSQALCPLVIQLCAPLYGHILCRLLLNGPSTAPSPERLVGGWVGGWVPQSLAVFVGRANTSTICGKGEAHVSYEHKDVKIEGHTGCEQGRTKAVNREGHRCEQ